MLREKYMCLGFPQFLFLNPIRTQFSLNNPKSLWLARGFRAFNSFLNLFQWAAKLDGGLAVGCCLKNFKIYGRHHFQALNNFETVPTVDFQVFQREARCPLGLFPRKQKTTRKPIFLSRYGKLWKNWKQQINSTKNAIAIVFLNLLTGSSFWVS